jgi:hypothetical protein
MTKNWEKFTAEQKIKYFFDQKLQFTYPLTSIKEFQVAEAFSPQRRTSSTSKHEISIFLYIFVVLKLPSWIRIPNPDPDPLT